MNQQLASWAQRRSLGFRVFGPLVWASLASVAMYLVCGQFVIGTKRQAECQESIATTEALSHAVESIRNHLCEDWTGVNERDVMHVSTLKTLEEALQEFEHISHNVESGADLKRIATEIKEIAEKHSPRDGASEAVTVEQTRALHSLFRVAEEASLKSLREKEEQLRGAASRTANTLLIVCCAVAAAAFGAAYQTWLVNRRWLRLLKTFDRFRKREPAPAPSVQPHIVNLESLTTPETSLEKQDMTTEFFDKLEHQLTRLQTAVDCHDIQTVTDVAEWFAGAPATLGYDQFTVPAQDLQHAVAASETVRIQELMSELEELANAVLPGLATGAGT